MLSAVVAGERPSDEVLNTTCYHNVVFRRIPVSESLFPRPWLYRMGISTSLDSATDSTFSRV
jgi:hypothetical protein